MLACTQKRYNLFTKYSRKCLNEPTETASVKDESVANKIKNMLNTLWGLYREGQIYLLPFLKRQTCSFQMDSVYLFQFPRKWTC